MHLRVTLDETAARKPVWAAPRTWALWTTPVSAKLYVLTLEAAILGVSVMAIMHARLDSTSSARAAVICALAVGYTVASDRVSMLRRYLQMDRRTKAWTNQTSIWTFAAALVLPAAYAIVVVLVIYTHILIRGWRHQAIRTYRVVFSIATTLLGVFAATGVDHLLDAGGGVIGADLRGNATIVAQLTVYTSLSLAATVVGIRLYAGVPTLRAAVPPKSAVTTEVMTLMLGVLAAQALVRDVWLTPIILVLAAALYRSSLVHQLAKAAQLDTKTGLLNAGAWRARAVELTQMSRGSSAAAVLLLVDLDLFKNINDEHGHLAGDAVLEAVGAGLRAVLRTSDCVGRFGGEEFAVLLPDSDAAAGQRAAERIRAEVAARSTQLGTPITASVGIALYPLHGSALDDLLASADTALYLAKDMGRDRAVAHSTTTA